MSLLEKSTFSRMSMKKMKTFHDQSRIEIFKFERETFDFAEALRSNKDGLSRRSVLSKDQDHLEDQNFKRN